MNKVLNDYTLNDVKKMVSLAWKMSDKGKNVYIQLDDEYSNNPIMYLSTRERHPGGGRVTWGYVNQENDIYAEMFSNKPDEYYSKDVFCEKLYNYIKEKY